MATDKKQIAFRLFDEVWNKGKVELLDTFITPFTIIRDPYIPIKTKGVTASKEYLHFFKTAFPDLFLKIEDQIAEGDKVVTYLSATGTHKGEFLGLAPTFKKATIPCFVMHRFEGDKIVESFVMWDAFGFFKAAGVDFAKLGAFAGV